MAEIPVPQIPTKGVSFGAVIILALVIAGAILLANWLGKKLKVEK